MSTDPERPDPNATDGGGDSAQLPEQNAQVNPEGMPEATPPTSSAPPTPESAAPEGLDPSPGIAPPEGLAPPADPAAPQQPEQPPVYQDQPPQQAAAYPQQPEQPAVYPPQQDQSAGSVDYQQQAPAYAQPQYADGQAQYANAGQAPQDQQYPQQGYGQEQYPQQGEAAPRKGLPTGALIGIIAGGVVLLLIIAAVVWAVLAPRGGGGGFAGLGSESPSEAVESYLTALSEGDAETALGYVDAYEADTLLSAEVLQHSNELAPISGITVAEAVETGPEQYRVDASFTIGDQQVDRSFEVWQYDDTVIGDGLVRFGVSAFDGLGPTVNGVEYNGESTSVFPGAYELGLETEGFEVSGMEGPLYLGESSDADSLYELTPAPTEETVQTFREMVSDSLKECLKSKSVTTDCGMDVSGFSQDGYKAIDGTVERSLKADGKAALKSLEPRANYEHPTLLESSDYIGVDMTLEAKKGSERVQFELLWGGELGRPSVDFSDEEPTVSWD